MSDADKKLLPLQEEAEQQPVFGIFGKENENLEQQISSASQSVVLIMPKLWDLIPLWVTPFESWTW